MNLSIPSQIQDSEVLWRHIHPKQYIYDYNLSDWRVSSAAFKDQKMSVDRGNYTTLRRSLAYKPEHSLIELKASEFRKYSCELKSDPIDTNPAHALVINQLSSSKAKELAKMASVLVYGKNAEGNWIKGNQQKFMDEL